MAKPPYTMTLSLNVLNHLGLNLYSNTASVLAEVVANAWDADAESVDIEISKAKIQITDDGHGMDQQAINEKYLTVGYRRREHPGEATTPKFGRAVMGRKGIGKLSLFSVARCIEVHTVRDGARQGFRMELDEIQTKIQDTEGAYDPPSVPESDIEIKAGTRIILTKLKKRVSKTPAALRRRLARRFSVIGDRYNFQIALNGDPITIADRDYFKKLQFLWRYGDDKELLAACSNLEKSEDRPNKVDGQVVTGWIGAVNSVRSLRDGDDSLNTITIVARGKLAQEDVLETCGTSGMVSKYLIGEIHADFLDQDSEEDIATSSRQKFVEDDPRFVALTDWMRDELRSIRSTWGAWRGKAGTELALKIPAVKAWYEELGPDDKKRAGALLGKINQLTVDNESDRQNLMKHSVLAFESLRYKRNLASLDSIDPEGIERLASVFAGLNDIEATLYHQIVRERIQVIKQLRDKVETDALEKVVQQHLFKNIWLLDPSWERATGTSRMEEQATKEFAKITAKLSKKEKDGRLDIRYTTTSGKHVIVELKRPDRSVSTTELIAQVSKYRSALRKLLRAADREGEPVEVVCIIGRDLTDWSQLDGREESGKMLAAINARVVFYDQLLDNAFNQYQQFLDKNEEAGRVTRLIQAIEEWDPDSAGGDDDEGTES